MGQKDISEKLLEDYNDVFADIVNVLLFQGRNVVEPYTLSAVKVKSQYKANDSKLHVFEIAWLTEEQVNMFQSDFRIVAEYFTQIRKNNEYVPTEQEIRHVDEVLKLLSVFGGEEGIEKFLSARRKKEDDKMAGVIDRMVEERAEKRAQEKAEKIAADMAQSMAADMAQNMAQDMVQDITKEMAVKFVKGGLPLEQVAEAMGVNAQQVKDWIAVRK